MSKKLPIVLSAQIISGEVRVRCIGIAQGAISGATDKIQSLRKQAEMDMHAGAKNLGGDIIIDPIFDPPRQWHSGVVVSASCQVGVYITDELEGSSE